MKDKVFKALLEEAGLPLPYEEYEFHHDRLWRCDYLWHTPFCLALEVEGAVWVRGRHTRGSGFVKDIEKYNALACEGFRLIRVQPKDLHKTETINLIRRALYA